MKKWLTLAALSFSTLGFSALATATPQQELSDRLQLNDGFSATFTQKVTSPEGEVVMEGKGNVEISRPSMFRWVTTMLMKMSWYQMATTCGTTAHSLSKSVFTIRSKRPSKPRLYY